jgi:hypothetical protein
MRAGARNGAKIIFRRSREEVNGVAYLLGGAD